MGLSVYRIVQESLTNVVRPAAPARCRVTVTAEERGVRVRVRDDGPGGGEPPGPAFSACESGVALCGGSLTAAPHSDGGFEVSAVLPHQPGRAVLRRVRFAADFADARHNRCTAFVAGCPVTVTVALGERATPISEVT